MSPWPGLHGHIFNAVKRGVRGNLTFVKEERHDAFALSAVVLEGCAGSRRHVENRPKRRQKQQVTHASAEL